MLIIADENIPQVLEAFSEFGEVRLVAGRGLSSDSVKDADVLLVRSVTRVNEKLLAGSRVKFVGTATIGTDHIDLGYLEAAGIEFASAAGSNAQSVVEYVVAALLEIAVRHGLSLEGKTLGIVGHGNIGSRLARVAPVLGLKVLVCDPPLQRARVPGQFTSLDVVLSLSDFVTFHVPLNMEGVDRTHHMVGAAELDHLKPTCFVINTSRGSVIENPALLQALEDRSIAGAVLDVWEPEPRISKPLFDRVEFGTPHIAGYSIDGKLNGTLMMAQAVGRWAKKLPRWRPVLPIPAQAGVPVAQNRLTTEQQLLAAVRCSYDIGADHDRLAAGMARDEDQRAAHFDKLRRDYPVRREFEAYHLESGWTGSSASERLRQFGFRSPGR